MGTPYQILEHTADIGFEARGTSLAELFANAGRALLDLSIDGSRVAGRDRLEVELSSDDLPSLLVDFLSELLFLVDSGRHIPALIEVDQVSDTHLAARLWGEPRDLARHPWKLIVKAVTYHGLDIGEKDGTWRARVFLDI
jgi:SHS2 domain-containing protein